MKIKKYCLCHINFIVSMICFLFFISSVGFLFANDSIVEITPKGLQFKKDENISIEKEELYISLKKVEVSYVFKNHSDKDITVEIAFPIPPYNFFNFKETNYSHKPDFSDFMVQINDQNINYKKEVKALVKGKDYADILKRANISIEDFGKYDFNGRSRDDLSRLQDGDKKKLIKLGIISTEGEPLWTVSIKYHWSQIFPANSIVNVKHSYSPYYGGSYEQFERWENKLIGEISKEIVTESCLDQKTKKAIEKKIKERVEKTGEAVLLYYQWVPYIRSTANNWKKPIKDFYLVLEKPEGKILTLCFDYELVKTNPMRFKAHIENFVPKRDLKVYFISK